MALSALNEAKTFYFSQIALMGISIVLLYRTIIRNRWVFLLAILKENFDFELDPLTIFFSWYPVSAILGSLSFIDGGSIWWYMNVTMSYLSWISLACSFIMNIGWTMTSLEKHTKDSTHSSKPTVKMKQGKKHRLRQALWFKRRKKRLKRLRVSKDNDHLEEDSDDEDWWDIGKPMKPSPPPLHRVLHKIGDSIANDFDELCYKSPILTSLIGPDERFGVDFPLNSKRSQRTCELLYYGGQQVIDLTKITSVDHTLRWQTSYYTMKGSRIVFDSGASISISPNKDDFIELDTRPETVQRLSLNTVSNKVQVKGVGKARFMVYTDSGQTRYLETTAFWVPDSSVTLFSVCRYCWETKDGARFQVDDDGCSFHFTKSSGGGKMKFNISEHNFLPTTSAFQQFTEDVEKTSRASRTYNIVDTQNINLTRAQKTLLKAHFCLGHWNMQWIQYLFRKGILRSSDSNVTKEHTKCQCSACNFAKQTRRPKETIRQELKKEKDGNLKKNQLRVGGMVSSDQFISSVPGRLPNTYGRETDSQKYVGGTVFIDEASGFTFLENQVSVNANETIKAKNRFEREASRFGVRIQGYRADNGIYRSEDFMNALKQKGQTIQFSGIGAHHHNGIAERTIRTISNSARAMMIHAILHNPGEVQMDLWPFAIKYAVYIWNKMPRMESGLSPEEVFYNIKSDHEELRQAKCWGCPAYVLDPKLQDGKSLPRWNPRSKLGQFLGRSDAHASSVGLIRNLQTGKVTAQFHVVYDNHFTTVNANTNEDGIKVPDNFNELMRFSRENHIDEDDIREMNRPRRQIQAPTVNLDQSRTSSGGVGQSSEGAVDNTSDDTAREVPVGGQRENYDNGPSFNTDNEAQDSIPVREDSTTDGNSNEPRTESEPINQPTSRYPTRDRSRPKFFHDEFPHYLYSDSEETWYDALLLQSDLKSGYDSMTRQFDIFNLYKEDDFDAELLEGIHPFAFAARANAEDTPNYTEAMASPDAEGFREAMQLEIDQLQSMQAWIVVPRQKAIDMNKKVIDSVWAFKRKRYPDGLVKKLKARLCIRGDQQKEGVDYFDTYSPVVSWSTVRLLLILSVMMELKTKQVDYTLAFVHAPMKHTVFIEMPKGYELEGHVLELKRNLYGAKDAPMNFFYHLQDQLKLRGFKPCATDPGLFLNEETGCMILVYVDDCIFFHRDEKTIDKTIGSLQKGDPKNKDMTTFLLNVEEDYAGFLGIDIHKHKDGSIELLQKGLVDRILKALKLDGDDVTVRLEPAAREPLGKDENGAPRKEDWSYPSLVGMMLYLSSNSRPDIAFAVNQAARFNHCPRLSHEVAIKRIARYLKGTRDRGLIIHPDKDNFQLELFADADFAGLWNVEDSDDPVCVRSRTGYVITLGGVPLTWSSKLQTEIATSTMHAEYIALSTSMRELIPVQNILDDLCKVLSIKRDEATKLVTVHEDNEPALKLANSPLPKITPQSKHFAVKYHWFREKLEEMNVVIKHVKTNFQKADSFTKGLTKVEFKTKRRLLMGW